MTIRRQTSSTTRPYQFLMVSSSDHVTAITGATITLTISKNGGSFGAASGAVSEIGSGWYSWAGNATDRNTNGELLVHATATGCDPFDGKLEIVPWDPFDSAGLGLTNVDATISSRATNTGAAAATWNEARSGHVTAGSFGEGVASVQGNVTGSVGSVTGNVGGNVTGSVGSVATGGITSGSFAASAIDATAIASAAITSAKFATDAIDANALATTAANEIRDAILTDATRFAGANINATISSRATQTSVDTGNAARIAATLTVQASSTTTNVRTDATQATGFYDGMIIVVVNAAGVAARTVTSYSNTNGAFTVAALPFTPTASDTLYVIGEVGFVTAPTAATVAGAVWDEARASHTTAGTFGQGVASVQGNVTGSVGSVTGAVGSVGTGGIAASSFAANAIDSAALATSAANEIRDAILSDSTPFQGARIDAAISSRASQTSLTTLSDAVIAASLTAATGSTTTEVRTGATQATGFYDGMLLVVRNSAGVAARSITSYNSTNGAFTVSTLPFTPSNGDAVYVIGDVPGSGGGGGGPTLSQIVNGVWDEPRSSHTTSGTFGQGAASVQGDVTGSVGSVATGGISASSFAANAVDSAALATTAVNEIRDAILSDSTPFQGARIDAAISSRATNAGAAAAVWDEARSGHTTAGTFGQGVASVQGNVTGSTASIASGGITASSFAANAIDSAALAASAANEIRDSILSDSTPFQGARIDATISSRASQTSLTTLSDSVIAAALTAATGSTTTEVRTGATQATGFYDGMLLVVRNSAGVAARSITGYNSTNGAFTVSALPFTPANGDAVYVIGDVPSSGGGGGGPTLSQIVNGVWDEPRSSHTTSGTFGQGVASVQGNVTGSVGSVATGGITAGSFAASAVDSAALATSAVNEIRDSILSDATPFQGGRIDAAISSRATDTGAAAAVWDEARAGHTTAGTFGQGVASVQGNVTGSTASIATGGIAASSFAANAVDSAALATTAVNEIRDAILSDSTPFQGARIDAAISSRSTDAGAASAVWNEARAGHTTAGTFGQGVASVQGAVTGSVGSVATGGITSGTFAADAIDAAALATSAANEVRDAILSDSTPFQGARIDAAISSRASQTSLSTLSSAVIAASPVVAAGSTTTNVRTNATQATGFFDGMTLVVVNAAGVVARQITAYNNTNGAFTVTALPFTPAASDQAFVIAQTAASGLTAGQVSAAVWDEARTSHTTAGTFGEGVGLSAAAQSAIDTTLTASHGAGSWQSGGGSTAVTRVQANVTLDAATNQLLVTCWLEGSAGVIAGTTNGTFRLYNTSGSPLTALTTDAAPDANGVFTFAVTAPSFVVGETATYARFTIDYLSITYPGVLGVTFSRAS